MAKRGRPAKAGKRYANGHLKPQDQISEGIAMRRRATLELAGAERDMRAEYPLGVCRARVLILELEHLAGLEYARLRERMVERHKNPQSCLGQMMPSGEGSVSLGVVDPEQEAKNELRYLKARDALKAAGSRAFHQIQNVVVFGRWPRFLDTARRRPPEAWKADERDIAALRQGLRVIADALGMRGDVDDKVAELPDSVASFLLRQEQRLNREGASASR